MSTLYREYDPATLERLHRVLLEMLGDFIALCDRHGIRWWTEFGTTLGALRHGGMIPWDDDIDLGMLREDYGKFLAAVEEDLGDKYYVLDGERPGCPFPMARFCLRGTVFRDECYAGIDLPFGIFLDIYCYDRLSDDPKEAHRQWVHSWVWGKLMVLREVRSPVLYIGGVKAVIVRAACFLGHYALRLLTRPGFPYRMAMRWTRRCEGRETARVFHPFDTKPFMQEIRLDELFPTEGRPFGGLTVQVPKTADAYMRKYFGDYMKLPPPESRHNHPPAELDFGGHGGDGGDADGAAEPVPPSGPGRRR